MNAFHFDINSEQVVKVIEDYGKRLTGPELKRGVRIALNNTAKELRTIISNDIRKEYNIKKRDLDRQAISIGYATTQGQWSRFTIDASKKNLPLISFIKGRPPKPKSLGASARGSVKSVNGWAKGKSSSGNAGIKVEILRGRTEVIAGAFLLNSRRGGLSIMHRSNVANGSSYGSDGFMFRHKRINSTGSDTPIGAMFTKSPFYTIFHDRIAAHVMQSGGKLMVKNIEHMLDVIDRGVIRMSRFSK